MSKATEKRKHPRVHAKGVSAHINFADKSDPCSVLDISAGGMLVETLEPLPTGIPVAVNLAQPGWLRVLRLPGRVVWALAPKAAAKKGSPPGMRIRFDPLEPDSAEMLLELLHSLGIGETPPPDLVGAIASLPPGGGQKPSPPRPALQLGALAAPPAEGPPPGAPGGLVLPGARSQELALGDLVAHISRTDVLAIGRGKAQAEDDGALPAQVRDLKLQLAGLQAALDARDRELAEAKDALQAKQLLLEKVERERRAAETAIQRLSMQLAARR